MIPRQRMTASSRFSTLAVVVTLALAGCETPSEITGAGAGAYLARVAVNGVTAQLMQGPPPPEGAGPSVDAPAFSEVITGGSSQLEFSANGQFQTVAVFVDGVEGHYLVSLPTALAAAELVVTIGGLPPTLEFDALVAVANPEGEFGPYGVTQIQAMEVIGGDIQVSVTWNTVADVDLHVIDPSGEEIYYGNRSSASGGKLDLDANAACSTSEIFQENIGWLPGTAPAGQYTVRVDYWSSCDVESTEFVVTVSRRPGVPVTPITPGGGVQTFYGTLTGNGTGGGAGDGITITTFRF